MTFLLPLSFPLHFPMHRIILHLMQQMEKGVLDLTDFISSALQHLNRCVHSTEIIPGKQAHRERKLHWYHGAFCSAFPEELPQSPGFMELCAAQAA